jgi:hypothetical protein
MGAAEEEDEGVVEADAAAAASAVAGARGWEAAAGCRGLRHRLVDHRHLAVALDRAEACRGRLVVFRDRRAVSQAALVREERARSLGLQQV